MVQLSPMGSGTMVTLQGVPGSGAQLRAASGLFSFIPDLDKTLKPLGSGNKWGSKLPPTLLLNPAQRD